MAQEESTVLHLLLKLLVVLALVDAGITISLSLLKDILLDILKQLLNVLGDTVDAASLLLQCIAAHYLDSTVLQVASTQNQTYGNTLQLVVGKLKARTLVVGIVKLHGDTLSAQSLDDRCHLLVNLLHLLRLGSDRNNYHLDRSQTWRQYQSVIIAVSHDECTNQSGRNTPRCSPYILRLVLLIKISNLECLGKVLTQEVAGTALQRLTVLHHSLDGVSVQCTGKTLSFALHTLYHRHSHPLLGKLSINLQHLLCLSLGLLAGGMSSVALLPEELAGAQEWACTHLPTHYVTPLVAHQWQIAP